MKLSDNSHRQSSRREQHWGGTQLPKVMLHCATWKKYLQFSFIISVPTSPNWPKPRRNERYSIFFKRLLLFKLFISCHAFYLSESCVVTALSRSNWSKVVPAIFIQDWWEPDVWWYTPVTPHPSPEIWEIEGDSHQLHCPLCPHGARDISLLQIFCLNSSLPPFLWIVFTVYNLPSSV